MPPESLHLTLDDGAASLRTALRQMASFSTEPIPEEALMSMKELVV